jgi:hypothetical protein
MVKAVAAYVPIYLYNKKDFIKLCANLVKG